MIGEEYEISVGIVGRTGRSGPVEGDFLATAAPVLEGLREEDALRDALEDECKDRDGEEEKHRWNEEEEGAQPAWNAQFAHGMVVRQASWGCLQRLMKCTMNKRQETGKY